MTPGSREHSIPELREIMRQRGLEAQVVEHQDPYRLGIESTSPLGEGDVYFQDASSPRDPWTILPPRPERLDTYRISYSGDGDWIRLAQEAGLDGLIAAFRTEYGVLVEMGEPEELFGDLGTLSPEVLVNVRAVDPDKPVLESSHAVNVYLGALKLPVTYMFPPFGIHSLERVARQILLYADVPPTEYGCAAPECRTVTQIQMPEGAPRQESLAMIKSHLCSDCLSQALSHGQGATLPIAPKGWDQ